MNNEELTELAEENDFTDLDNDDLETLYYAYNNGLNLEHVNAVFYDGSTMLDRAVEIVEQNPPISQERRIEDFIDNTGISSEYRYLVDEDIVRKELDHDEYYELYDGDVIVL